MSDHGKTSYRLAALEARSRKAPPHPEAWRWLEARLREATGGMANLQRRRIESALADAGKISNDLDTANAALAEIIDRVDILRATLHAVRLGMIREADEATPAPTTPETAALARDGIICAQCYDYLDAENRPAAGPWEPYSDEAYERLQSRGVVLAEMQKEHFEAMARFKDHKTGEYFFSAGGETHPHPPLRIARIIPPKEEQNND